MANEGRRWFEQRKEFQPASKAFAKEGEGTPDLYTLCPSCGEMLYNEQLVLDLNVCRSCDHHLRISAVDRLTALCDEDEFEWHDAGLEPVDALGFVDSKPYPVRLAASRKKAGRKDAFLSVSAHIEGLPVEVGCFDFKFMGGSMGSVVGEAITRLYERAAERRVPAIVISASGGARMQEGVLSLMQMAKTCAALARLHDDAGMPFISVITHPTTGGVAASFAMLGDVILAEPGALVGFAGPRVIKETIGEELPEGFQTSEYLLEHGLIDRIVSRPELRTMVSQLLRQLLRLPPVERRSEAG
ncbi:MAG: acetyl-CoA carboxylase carboxyl transferase subunit beta [Myxococcota bacterium]|jgi:acetyl-CoA carboxylase carboxyl transferase subunit beta